MIELKSELLEGNRGAYSSQTFGLRKQIVLLQQWLAMAEIGGIYSVMNNDKAGISLQSEKRSAVS